MQKLRLFHSDKETLDEVRGYFIAYLEQEALKRLFNFERTDGLAEARKILEEAFDNLDVQFAPAEPKIRTVDNQAR
mgnify:CR=1 FL=1